MFQCTKHFVTGNFTSHASFVDDKTYSLILDNIVKATCDIVVVRESDRHVLLGKRVGLPWSDWWVPGGRLFCGEDIPTTVARILKRELGVDLYGASSPSDKEALQKRIRNLNHFTFCWDSRTQPPQENGTCDVSVITMITVSDAEVQGVTLKPSEYSELKWIDPLSPPVESATYHPALKQALRDLTAYWAWQEVERWSTVGGDELQHAVQKYMALKSETTK